MSGCCRLGRMRRANVLASVAALFACGCAGSEVASSQVEPPKAEVKKAPEPKFTKQSELGLINGWKVLNVGEKEKVAEDFFERPDRASALRDLPPGLEGSYRSQGWQSANEGFGLLLYDNRVALSMRYFEHADNDLLADLLKRYQRRFPKLAPLQQNARKVRYWFLESGEYRLMLCAVETPSGDLTVTASVGDSRVMEYLGMDPKSALRDATQVEPAPPAAPSESGALQTP